jgi:hypothetical protein
MDGREHICDPTIPVCGCGLVWEYGVTSADGVIERYTTAEVVTKFNHIYGKPHRANYFVLLAGQKAG